MTEWNIRSWCRCPGLPLGHRYKVDMSEAETEILLVVEILYLKFIDESSNKEIRMFDLIMSIIIGGKVIVFSYLSFSDSDVVTKTWEVLVVNLKRFS